MRDVAEPKPIPMQVETPAAAVSLPDPRLLQANERTLLAWIRTAIALMAFGFVVARLGLWLRIASGTASPTAFRFSVLIGAGLVALGTIANAFAVSRFLSVKRALIAGRPVPSDSYGELTLATSLVLIGGALTAYLLLR